MEIMEVAAGRPEPPVRYTHPAPQAPFPPTTTTSHLHHYHPLLSHRLPLFQDTYYINAFLAFKNGLFGKSYVDFPSNFVRMLDGPLAHRFSLFYTRDSRCLH